VWYNDDAGDVESQFVICCVAVDNDVVIYVCDDGTMLKPVLR